jgi:DNA modification methylase
MNHKITENYAAYNTDCVEFARTIPDNSIGLSVFSPPFPGMYAYTDSERDMGNCTTTAEMMEHFDYLIPELLRATMPGRLACVHLCQLTSMKSREGWIGLHDYRGDVIRGFSKHGWRFAGEVTIDKNPQIQATRNKERGLLFKSLATDASMMRMALADYLIYFRKDGENTVPIQAGKSAKYNEGGGWITEAEWIEWAAPVWYRHIAKDNTSESYTDYPVKLQSTSGIRETDVLNVSCARDDKDERHLCPLQLGVIERCIKLWSAPGDLVFSPFMGIGSEGYQAIKFGRKFMGTELKPSYFNVAVRNLDHAVSIASGGDSDLLAFSEDEVDVATC